MECVLGAVRSFGLGGSPGFGRPVGVRLQLPGQTHVAHISGLRPLTAQPRQPSGPTAVNTGLQTTQERILTGTAAKSTVYY